MKYSISNWHNNLTLELEMLEGYRNINHSPASLYARAILVDPDTHIRYYQKLVTIHFTEEDKIDI
jgi:hypothetical protein